MLKNKKVIYNFFELSFDLKKIKYFMCVEEVLRLIETLVKKEPSIMAVSHVPLLLCSYNASLSVTDQIILRVCYCFNTLLSRP